MEWSKGILVEDIDYQTGSTLDVTNYCAREVPRLIGPPRWKSTVTEIILHETVTRDLATTIKVLKRRKLGVHFIIDGDGAVTQHGDVVHDALSHAGRHNKPSVGIEVVNPYYPKYLREELPWGRTIPARWAHEKQYVLPTPEQAETTHCLVNFLTLIKTKRVDIPREWIGLDRNKKRLAMSRVPSAVSRKPGIYAHTYFGHADGAWLVLYHLLRLEASLAPFEAYDKAVELGATNRWWVDLEGVI